MNEFTGGERRYKPNKPSAIKKIEGGISKKAKAARLFLAGAAAGLGGGDVVTHGEIHQKFMQGVQGIVREAGNAAADLDNRDFNASSAGIPSQQVSEGMQKAGIPVPQPKK